MVLSHLDLFSGIGCFSLAAQKQKIDTKQFVEIDPFCQQILTKNFPNIPIHSDIKTYTTTENFDIITGGFPCQDLSVANVNGIGLFNKDRSGLWFEYLRLIKEIQPKGIVIENVPPTLNRNWLYEVLKGLFENGYNAIWQTFQACDFGYLHRRSRLYIIAYSNQNGQSSIKTINRYFDKNLQRKFTRVCGTSINSSSICNVFKSIPERFVFRVSNGITGKLDKLPIEERKRIGAIGNSLIPEIAEFNLYILKSIIADML